MSDAQRVALVTGASRGLGLAFANQLLSEGWRVFASYRSSPGAALESLSERYGSAMVPVPLDVGDPLSIQRAAATLRSTVGKVDLLVNNAGVNSRSVANGGPNVRFGELEPVGLLEQVRVNAIGPLLVTQALVDLLDAANGRVVSVSSWLGSIEAKRSGGNYGYSSSKAALNMLMRAAAFDLVPRGIVCVVVNPGWVQTDMGGSRAPLTPAESVAGILKTTRSATLSDNGSFLQWDGSPHPW